MLNHSIFWKNLAPANEGGGEPPSGALGSAIETHFGSLEGLVKKMNAEGAAVQGSGWVWLGLDKELKKLVVDTTANQDPLVTKGGSLVPLIGIDVWEHAYYSRKTGKDGVKLLGSEKYHERVSVILEKAGQTKTSWAILQKFNYNDSLELNIESLPIPAKHSPDQSIELTNKAMDFLSGIFQLYDLDNDGGLRPTKLNDLFEPALYRFQSLGLGSL